MSQTSASCEMSQASSSTDNANAVAECKAVVESIARKADKNKRRARGATLFLTASTAAVPVLIGLSGDSFLLAKLVPSILAALSAIGAAWVGLERPHERWSLYRRYQRILEAELLKYRFLLPPYNEGVPEQTLARKVADAQLELHDQWAGLLPSAKDLSGPDPGGAA